MSVPQSASYVCIGTGRGNDATGSIHLSDTLGFSYSSYYIFRARKKNLPRLNFIPGLDKNLYSSPCVACRKPKQNVTMPWLCDFRTPLPSMATHSISQSTHSQAEHYLTQLVTMPACESPGMPGVGTKPTRSRVCRCHSDSHSETGGTVAGAS